MPSKQRIAFVANTSWSIYKFRLQLLQVLAAKGFEVYVLAPRDKYSVFFEQLPGISFIELKELKSKSISLLDDWRLYAELLRHYRQLRPQLAFHYTIKANIYATLAASRINCPVVSVITGLGYMFEGKGLFRFAASQLYRYALRKTKEVWFLNPDDQQIFINSKLVTAGKTFLLPGEGVDPNVFYPAPYKENNKPFAFLLIARMIEHKGVYEFAAAAAMLRAKNINAQCCILGFFEQESAVAIAEERLTEWQAAGNIIYLGATDNVAACIEKADCVVLPSYREGMPLSLLEGASMCKALIATDVPGCRQIVADGINGFLCKPKHAQDLASKMEQYCALGPGEKTKMGLNGRDLVMQSFTKDIIAGIYLHKLEKLLERTQS